MSCPKPQTLVMNFNIYFQFNIWWHLGIFLKTLNSGVRMIFCKGVKKKRCDFWAPLVAQTVKNLRAMQETQVQPLGWEDVLEKKMATHSSIFVCKSPWTEEFGGLQSMESQRVRHDWATNTFTWNLCDHYKFRGQNDILKGYGEVWLLKLTSIFIASSPTFLGYGVWIVQIGGENCLNCASSHTCMITDELISLNFNILK